MTVVIGTAGHIDHGKTTLLRALTGIDADRLPAERARGMTIDVGYAHMALPDGTELDFVDVPGHDRLVGNMLVGAGEIDAALLVVAADDGPRAQTHEHLGLLDALGIEDGLVVVTKTDAVSAERVDEVVADARALIAPTSLRGSPIVAVSASTGAGLDPLRAALVTLRDRALARRIAVPSDSAVGSRLAIDRVFTIRGRGTVVTGTLRGVAIERGAVLRVVPGPADRAVRVREVQVHGRTVERAGPGRVALNLAGEGTDGLERGTVLTTDPGVVSSDRLLVAVRPPAVLPGDGEPAITRRAGLSADRAPVTVHLGTVRITGFLGRGGRDGMDLGNGEGSAILRLDRAIAAAPGDRFVLRRPSPIETLAGGRVLDPEPPRGVARRRTTPERVRNLAGAAVDSAAWCDARLDLHGALGGAPPAIAPDVAVSIDDVLVEEVDRRPGVRVAELTRTAVTALRRLVSLPVPAGEVGDDIGRRIVGARLEQLVESGRLIRAGDRVSLPGAMVAGPSATLLAAMERLVASLSTVTPPPLGLAAREAGCPPEGVRLLEAENRIVRLDGELAWAFPTYRGLVERALTLAANGPLTPAAFRDATGTSRKYVMAILEDLDRRAILRRTPDGHVPGPRAAHVVGIAEPLVR
jgi:selenocysteine-specific elongation factor